ncbi:MAG: hypothetical protein ABSD13_11100 [Candidatus Korobacteraceae bacterium]|jgi:hypothetical protein
MRRLLAVSSLALLSLLASGLAQSGSKAEANPAPKSASRPSAISEAAAVELPIHRVVLYKNGVGYFEHQGHVSGNQELNIRFTTAQLNDVLKSLTVVDLSGGKVGGVRYNSIAPLSQRLSTLRLGLDGNTDRAGFLNALRGARVEVRAPGTSATGRLLSVEEITRQDKEGNELKTTQLSLVSDSGELRSFDLTPATSVRILEGEMNREVGRYMSLLASARDKDVRQMTISTSGEGSREILVSYISEVPVWKSTYRIILPEAPGAKPLLQGWAIVDNTVGEDWKNIQLSLVAGAPQSFVEQISQPYYVRRPVVELPKTALLTPQTHEGTEYAPPTSVDDKAAGVSGGVVAGVPSGVGSGHGGGTGGGAYRLRSQAKAQSVDAFAASAPAESYEQSIEPQSMGEALGDMFEYAIKQSVTVLQNQSALVPIMQARVDAEKVTLWNEKEHTPVRALWLTNSSGLTLDAGTFNIVEAGAFAGEGLLAEVHPNERRLISYAADTAVRVKSEGASEQRPYTRLRAARGILFLTRELRQSRTYTVSNSDTTARSVVIEHPARSGWHFIDKDLKPEETSNSYYRFRVKVAPASSEKLVVAEYYPQETTYALNTIDTNVISFVLKTNGIQPEIEAALRKLLAKKDEIAAIGQLIKDRRGDVEEINKEQARIRENMKSLKGSPEEKALLQRYVTALNQQEDRLAGLNLEISAKEVELNARQGEYQQMAESMTFDQTR